VQKSTEINGHSGLDNSDWCIRFKTMGVNNCYYCHKFIFFLNLSEVS